MISKDIDNIIDYYLVYDDISKYLYEKYKDVYVYSNKEWYVLCEMNAFHKNRWMIDHYNLFNDEIDILKTEIINNELDINKRYSNNLKKKKIINKVIENLTNLQFRTIIITECKKLFLDKDFYEKLNSNPYLIGFNNGVYDLKIMEFRESKRDDYISYTVGYNYIKHENNDENIKRLNNILNKIYVDKESKEDFMNFCLYLLKNDNDKIHVMLGKGNNGQSLMMIFLTRLFNRDYEGYSCYGNNKKELKQSKNKRLICLFDIDEKELNAENLCEKGFNISTIGHLLIHCNTYPTNLGTSRIKILYHNSTFKNIEDCPTSLEDQYNQKIFPRDFGVTIDNQLRESTSVFMYELIKLHKTNIYNENNIIFRNNIHNIILKYYV